MNDFARKLKSCREKKKLQNSKWTQQYIAGKIGMARTTYTAYENGTKMPPLDTVNSIAILLDVSNDYLMGRTNIEKSYDGLVDLSKELFTYLPVVSDIAYENSMFKDDDIIGHFPTEKSFLDGGEYVWLKTTGNCMINVGIRDGSKVLIRLQSNVENGEIAAVCIDKNKAMLKKVYIIGDNITLVCEKSGQADQVYNKDRITIKGKAVYFGSVL